MIKIQIANVEQKKQEYINEITNVVAFRILVLQQSLSHLNGVVIDFDTGDFTSFKAVTKKIINIVGDKIDTLNGRKNYTNSIDNYRANPNNLGDINIAGLVQFCQFMLVNNNEQLKNLLVCEANNLLVLNDDILNNHGINTRKNIQTIKLAFSYEEYNEISSVIKVYFRVNSFTKVCSYCNLKSVTHQLNNANEVVESFELDHFYDKSNYPLLSYSLFNLVPSDHTCNVTNKGVTQFTDEYHVNPYCQGYSDNIKVVPIGLTTNYEVSKLEVEILEAPGSAIYKRINGNNQPNVEEGELGNLNVFKIRWKYSSKTHLASKVLETLHKENKYFKHIKKYFDNLLRLNKKENYKKWYEKEFDVRFASMEFNDKAYSKFCRDIHDYYFNMNKTRLNKYIIELIDSE